MKRDFKDRDTLHHWAVPKSWDGGSTYEYILRHTPADRFRGVFNSRFFEKAKANVFPTVFNEQYLDGGDGYELVNYWQSKSSPLGIKIEPAIPDIAGTNSGAQTKGAKVELDCVLGFVYDVDAIMIDYQLDSVDSTPLEARKKYINTWYAIARNSIQDLTEKGALLYMADEIDDGGSQLSVNVGE